MEVVCSNPVVFSHLNNYPKEAWVSCIVATTIIGIQSLRGAKLPIDQLWNLAQNKPSYSSTLPQVDMHLNSLKRGISAVQAKPTRSVLKESVRGPQRTEDTPRFTESEARRGTPVRQRGPSRSPFRKQTPRSSSKRRCIPKYLQHVDSKIRQDVRKDIAEYMSQVRDASPLHSSTPEYVPQLEDPVRPREAYVQAREEFFRPRTECLPTYSASLPRRTQEIDVQTSLDHQVIPELRLFEQPRNPTENSSILLEESKSNSIQTNQLIFTSTLEGTFTHLEQSKIHEDAEDSIPFDKDFETPRYPSESRHSKVHSSSQEEPDVLTIANKFLKDPFMAGLWGHSIESSNECVKSQPVPPLDLLGSEDLKPRNKWGYDKENQASYKAFKESNARQLSSPIMVETPSPQSYDDKFMGPMYQDQEFTRFL